jgi:hypothetical protein
MAQTHSDESVSPLIVRAYYMIEADRSGIRLSPRRAGFPI